MTTKQQPLDAELAYFQQQKDELLKKYEGGFVLIKGEHLAGVYPTAEGAYEAGLREFGLTPFLVKQVLRDEPVSFVPLMSVTPFDARL